MDSVTCDRTEAVYDLKGDARLPIKNVEIRNVTEMCIRDRFYIAIDILAHCFYSCRCGSCLLELLHSST